MTDEEITMCEALYFCISRKQIGDNLVCLLYEKIKNTEMDAYMYWLLNR